MIQKFIKKGNQKGFTLVELLIVIAIIGILSSIAIPQFSAYRVRAYNTASLSDAKNDFTASVAYFSDNQSGSPDLNALKAYGYKQTANVILTVNSLTQSSGSITASHPSGNKTYTVQFDGGITPL